MELEGRINAEMPFEGMSQEDAQSFELSLLGVYLTAKASTLTELMGIMERPSVKRLILWALPLTAPSYYFQLPTSKKRVAKLVKKSVCEARDIGLIGGHQNRLNMTISGKEVVEKIMMAEATYS